MYNVIITDTTGRDTRYGRYSTQVEAVRVANGLKTAGMLVRITNANGQWVA